MCGRCRQRGYLQRHGRRRQRRASGAPTAPSAPWPWGERSALFRLVVTRHRWTPEGRAGTPEEWDREMQRAYGPGVTPEQIAKACKAAVKFLPPDQALEGVRRTWEVLPRRPLIEDPEAFQAGCEGPEGE